MFRDQCLFRFHDYASVNVEPVTREKQHAEYQERKQCQHDRDRVRRFDLAFVELCEDVERRGLCASGEISGYEDRRTKFSDRARESQQRARNDRASQRRQRHVPERLPARGADRRRSFLKRSAHRVEDGFDHAERERERDKDIRQNDRAGSEHDLKTVRRQQTAERAVRSPKQQQSETGDGGGNRGRKRDRDDERVAAPEVVTRQDVSGEQTKDHVEDGGPEARGHRKLEREYRFGRISAAQNLSRPLLVPKMKIEASGRKTSGNIIKMSMPMLSGRTTSNPRTCRIAGTIVLMSISKPLPITRIAQMKNPHVRDNPWQFAMSYFRLHLVSERFPRSLPDTPCPNRQSIRS